MPDGKNVSAKMMTGAWGDGDRDYWKDEKENNSDFVKTERGKCFSGKKMKK